jgi:ferritin-like metal-binding protein YciE
MDTKPTTIDAVAARKKASCLPSRRKALIQGQSVHPANRKARLHVQLRRQTMATNPGTNVPERLRELFVVGLRNARALEHQALSIMTPQVTRIQNYPEVADRLRAHIDETNGQIGRLDEILGSLDESPSALKEAALSMSGAMAAIAHSFAGDEILKDSFANYAFENFEIASYKSLITMAEDGAFQSFVPLLQQTLTEEQQMAQWIDERLPAITRRYVELSAAKGAFAAKL